MDDELTDELLCAEIVLLGEVIAAVAGAQSPLDEDEIDVMLGVDCDGEPAEGATAESG